MDISKLISQKKAQHYNVKGNISMNIKDIDKNSRVVTGFYNTFNYLDSDLDIILKGAATKSINERGPESSSHAKIKHALFHDLNRLPGKIQVLKEETVNNITGIYFETKMTNTVEGNDTLQNYLEGVYDNHSIGFRYLNIDVVERKSQDWDKYISILVNPEEANEKEYFFIVKEIMLYEGSTVAFGANQLTPFLGTKGQNKEAIEIAILTRIDKLSKCVKNGLQSDETLYLFDLQVLQLKQLLKDLAEQLPINNSTLKEPLLNNDKKAIEGFNYDYLIKNIKF